LRDHSHYSADNSDVCTHCGQPLRPEVTAYGERRTNPTGLAVTILLHLLLVAIYLFQPKQNQKKMASAPGNEIVYIAPLPGRPKPRPQEQAPKHAVKTPKAKSAPERVKIQRLPDTITLPDEKPVAEPPKKVEPKPEPQVTDMQAYIEARRKQRGAPTPVDTPAEESDDARATRNALKNIASVNARGHDDRNQTGGVFEVTNKTFSSATVKFRGWNPNFKQRWLTQVTVELGSNPDIETAIINKMIELIRREKKGDFEWESHRLNRVVTMSARAEDTEQLRAFLFKEMFEDYKPPRR
jgi:type IV secretory pathway VirB10-like protein